MGPEFPGPAEDALLSWMLRLDDTIEPAAAARHLLDRYGRNGGPPGPGALGEPVRLLRETADYPDPRPRRLARRGERRLRPRRGTRDRGP